jgi:hypothetical protein
MCGQDIEDPRDGREGLRAFTGGKTMGTGSSPACFSDSTVGLRWPRHVTVGDDADFGSVDELLKALAERSLEPGSRTIS